jgi:hypothetical protein
MRRIAIAILVVVLAAAGAWWHTQSGSRPVRHETNLRARPAEHTRMQFLAKYEQLRSCADGEVAADCASVSTTRAPNLYGCRGHLRSHPGMCKIRNARARLYHAELRANDAGPPVDVTVTN